MKAISLIYSLSLFFSLLVSGASFAQPLVVTHVSPPDKSDHRFDYNIELLRLALEKTESDFGPFELAPAPVMSYARTVLSAQENRYPNFVFSMGYSSDLEDEKDLDYVRFPIHLGILGYRVCFIPANMQAEFEQIESAGELRRYLHGQSPNWVDTRILQFNGFSVAEVSEYVSLFKMVAAGHIQFFCRGINEVMGEYLRYQHLENLALDSRLAIFYPLPRFFYSNKENTGVIARITEGLQRAYIDGSLVALWERHYRKSIDFVNMHARVIFYFDSPLTEGIDFDYQHFTIDLDPSH